MLQIPSTKFQRRTKDQVPKFAVTPLVFGIWNFSGCWSLEFGALSRMPPDELSAIRNAFPSAGLFAEKDFFLSPDPFPIDAKFAKELEQLGHRLYVFQRACNELYQRSVKGKQPAWIAQYLDAGKPPELTEFSRQKQFRDDVPVVIRPDLILTESGYTIAEIDSVPGGIGLTGWLDQTYAALD